MLGTGSELRRELLERARILQAASREELEKIAKEYAEARRQFEEWQRTTLQQEMRAFSKTLADRRQPAVRQLQNDLDPTGPIVDDVLDGLRKNEFDPRQVNEMAGQIQQECLARASEVVGKVQGDFNREVSRLIETTARRLSEGFVVEFPQHQMVPSTPGPPIKIDDSLNMVFSRFEEYRNAMYGGMAGGMMASIGVGLVSLLFPPAAAVAGIATLIGSCIGGFEADKSVTVRRRDEAIGKLGAVLQKLMHKAQQQAIGQFNEIAAQYELEALEVLQKAAANQQTLLQGRLHGIEEARGHSQVENQSKAGELEATLKALERIEASLRPVVETSPAEQSNP